MSRSILSRSTGLRTIAAGLAAIMVATTACSDTATAPDATAREIARPSNIEVGLPGNPQVATFISVHVVDVNLNPVTEKAMVRFRWSQPKDSVFVMDNSAKDLDPAIGVVKIAAPKAAGYDACVRGMTAHFVADSLGNLPTCNSKFWLSFDINLGNVYMRRKPQLVIKMGDLWGNLLPGGAVRVYDYQGFNQIIADGQLGMDDPAVNDGKIIVNLPHAGQVVWGETKAPTGQWEFLGDAWYTKTFAWEEKYQTLIPHQQYTK